MSLQQVTEPMLLDSTGLTIAQKLEAIKDAVQPVNTCIDLDISLPTSGWSGSSGNYTYTYSNSKITTGCAVEVSFLESNNSGSVLYLQYEKVTGGVRFTSTKVPTTAIPVRVRIVNADAESVMATTADEVSTNAIPGSSNVQQALSSLSDQIAMKNASSFSSIASMIASLSDESTKSFYADSLSDFSDAPATMNDYQSDPFITIKRRSSALATIEITAINVNSGNIKSINGMLFGTSLFWGNIH